MALAASTALAGACLMADRPAQAQNTYADVPFNQGSLFYRPSGAKPPTTTTRPSYSAPRRFFRRQRGYTYAAPAPTYAYPTTAPGYVTAPRVVVPTTGYYYYPAR